MRWFDSRACTTLALCLCGFHIHGFGHSLVGWIWGCGLHRRGGPVVLILDTTLDLGNVIMSEVSQRRRNIVWHPLYLESKKNWYRWTYLQNRKRPRLRKGAYDCLGEEIVREFGKVMYTLLYLKWITKKDLLYSTWNSTQCYLPAWMGKRFGGEWIHVYVWLSPFAVHLKLSQHC